LYAQVCEEQALSYDSNEVHTPTIEKALTIYNTNKDIQRTKGIHSLQSFNDEVFFLSVFILYLHLFNFYVSSVFLTFVSFFRVDCQITSK
jgi:hypothetical protein